MKIAVICGMSDEKVHARLLPLIELEEVDEIYLVRRKPIKMSKVVQLSPPKWMQNSLILAELYRFFSLLSICVTKKPAVLYGIYFVPHGIYATVAGWIFNKPVIQELIGTDRLKVMRSKLLMSMLKSADCIGVRGSSSREDLINRGVDESKLFTPISVNAIDFDLFKPVIKPKIYDLIYCGRMDQNKQLDLLIRAVAVLRQTHPELRAVFVGDGPERATLQALTSELTLQKTIVFAGNQPYQQIPDYLNRSRIFMMASAFEGLPVAMIEALSCGLPVVVPNVGDIPDVAHHGVNAWVVNRMATEAYIDALSKLLGDERLYRQLKDGASKTRQRLIQEYTLDKAQTGIRQVLRNITR